MALTKSKTLENGVNATYWRIILVSLMNGASSTRVEVGLYLDKASRDAGNSPIRIFSYGFSPEANPFSVPKMDFKNPVKIAYEQLKLLPEFSGALDS